MHFKRIFKTPSYPKSTKSSLQAGQPQQVYYVASRCWSFTSQCFGNSRIQLGAFEGHLSSSQPEGLLQRAETFLKEILRGLGDKTLKTQSFNSILLLLSSIWKIRLEAYYDAIKRSFQLDAPLSVSISQLSWVCLRTSQNLWGIFWGEHMLRSGGSTPNGMLSFSMHFLLRLAWFYFEVAAANAMDRKGGWLAWSLREKATHESENIYIYIYIYI